MRDTVVYSNQTYITTAYLQMEFHLLQNTKRDRQEVFS
nr:MAG TPA: hypothetical protein [Caudoviricetes sp.]